MRPTTRLTAGALAAGLLLTTAAGTFAAKGTKAPGTVTFAAGQVSNLAPAGFTLTSTRKASATAAPTTQTLQVVVDAKTKERARKGTTGALVNGEYAVVVGRVTATGLTARVIVYSSTAFKGNRAGRRVLAALRHRAAGTVTAASATSVTIQTKNGKSRIFGIMAGTRFLVNGKAQQTVQTLTIGQTIVVRFARDKTTKTFVARAINIRSTTP
jgi:hypothetical protein